MFTYGEDSFYPHTAAARARDAGFLSCEEIGGDDAWRRYLPGEPHPNAFVTKLGTALSGDRG